MFKKPLISICIPTFNRADKLCKLVNDILKFEGSEIEVIVLDNLSTDNTRLLLCSVIDPRLKYVQNEVNMGGPSNILKALTLANGDYAFLCLDKDRLDYKNIGELIGRIGSDKGVAFGYCVLNGKNDSSDIIYEQGFASVLNMSYLSIHPTGMFYRTDSYKKSEVLKKSMESEMNFSFYPDLINGEMSFFGKSRIINLPLFYTETKEDCEKVPSFTYTNPNDVFFSPLKRFHEFTIYAKSVINLKLTPNQRIKLIGKLFERGLASSTFGYRNTLKDRSICAHYFVKPRKVSPYELIKIDLKFSYSFMKSDVSIGYFSKFYICILANFKLIYFLFFKH